MNNPDREEFAKALYLVGETFNEPVSDLRVEAYFNALVDLPLEMVTVGCAMATRSLRFFPKPVELRELIEGDREEAATRAWGAVLGEVRRVGYIGVPNLDDRALQAVRELFGSWQRMCERLPAEGPELLGWIKQFKQVYGSVERKDQRALTMGDLDPNVRQLIARHQKALPGVAK